jgi:CRISPR-associated protein Cas1
MRSLYITSNGTLHRRQNTLYFETEEGKRKYVPVENTQEILIFGEISINKKLLDFISQQGILLHFFNYYGYYSGTFYPREHNNSGCTILAQATFYQDKEKRLEIARKFVEGAIENIIKVLGYYNNRGTDLKQRIENIENIKENIYKVNNIQELMGMEGNCRDIYYGAFDAILNNEDFSFDRRSKQPPRNRLIALISFGNSLIYIATLSEIYKTHLDPRIGFLHSTNFRNFSLNLDLAEIFKPIIADRIIFTLINKKMINKDDFDSKMKGTYLSDKGRETYLREFDSRMEQTIKHPDLKRNVSYRRLIRLEAYKIEKHLLGDKKYSPWVARW